VVFKLAAELHETAAQSPVDLSPEILAQRTIERLDEIVMARTKTHLPRISMGDAARQAVDQMSAVMARGGAIGGITTGLKTLDCRTDGLNRGEFVLDVQGWARAASWSLAPEILRQPDTTA
jgi:replicative DNA helicase